MWIATTRSLRLASSGPDDRIELLDGLLVTKMPKLPSHSYTGAVQDLLSDVLPEGWCLRSQEPVTLPESEPEPDIAVVRGSRRDYARRHPAPSDVALILEIADSSLDGDRNVKKLIYARAGIPWYWIVDLINRRVEVYSQPVAGDYEQCFVYRAAEHVSIILDGAVTGELSVAAMLP